MSKQQNKIEIKGNSKENDKDHRKVGKIHHVKTVAIKQNTKTTIQNTFWKERTVESTYFKAHCVFG